MTGLGLHQAMRACANATLGADTLRDVTVAIQGYGKVASKLAPHLQREGARIIATDLFPEARARAAADGLEVLENPDTIYDVPCDIFAPCALGGVLNPETVSRLTCGIVCGSANNQLLDQGVATALKDRGILYAPDYVVNAGGVINISLEIGRPYEEEAARDKTMGIYDTVQRVIATAKEARHHHRRGRRPHRRGAHRGHAASAAHPRLTPHRAVAMSASPATISNDPATRPVPTGSLSTTTPSNTPSTMPASLAGTR